MQGKGKSDKKCTRCGQTGHTVNTCWSHGCHPQSGDSTGKSNKKGKARDKKGTGKRQVGRCYRLQKGSSSCLPVQCAAGIT